MNTTQTEYDKQISHVVKNLEAKQEELQLEISDVNKNLSKRESVFNSKVTELLKGFKEGQERLKLAMLSDYVYKLQKAQDANKETINDLATDLKSQFANLSQEFKKDFMKSAENLQTHMRKQEEWKINLMEKLNGKIFFGICFPILSFLLK